MTTPDLPDFRAMYEAHHPRIEKIIGYFSAKYGLAGDDAQEFAGWARSRLVSDEYAVLRKFQGKSKLSTYLTAVVANLAREYQVERRGRWRPSAAAARRGELAVRLERLVHHQGLRWDEAVEVVRTSGETDLPHGELVRMIAQLPARAPLRPEAVDTEALESVPSDQPADSDVLGTDADALRGRVLQALFKAIRGLPHEDQVALRLRYWEGMKVTEVARGTQRDPARLFKRIDRVLVLLRREMEQSGVSPDAVRELLDGLRP